jgi:hypothetical protein
LEPEDEGAAMTIAAMEMRGRSRDAAAIGAVLLFLAAASSLGVHANTDSNDGKPELFTSRNLILPCSLGLFLLRKIN